MVDGLVEATVNCAGLYRVQYRQAGTDWRGNMAQIHNTNDAYSGAERGYTTLL